MATTDSTPEPGGPVKTAELFKNGRSQAAPLPEEFRFEGTEVEVRRDSATGEVALAAAAASARTEGTLRDLFDRVDSCDLPREEFSSELQKLGQLRPQELRRIIEWADFPEDFMADRGVHEPRELDPF
jgi:antitoxin VapB